MSSESENERKKPLRAGLKVEMEMAFILQIWMLQM